jgi:hypothetical protein
MRFRRSQETPMTFEALPARTLDRRELQNLVDELAGRPELWRHHIAFSDTERHYVLLHRDDHVDAWLLCWTAENDTGWHDHDISSGAVRVVDGALEEHNPRIGGAHLTTIVPEGTSYSFGPDHIHRLTGVADRSVSIHAYSPPIVRMGRYTIDDNGIMRRTTVSYAGELESTDAA